MRRQRKAGLLLVALALWGVPGLLSLALPRASTTCCTSVSCCASGSCLMHARPVAMPKGCHMTSESTTLRRMQMCSCSLSSSDSSLSLTSRADFRFDLPRAASLPDVPSRIVPAAFAKSAPKVGFTSLPDQPPEALA